MSTALALKEKPFLSAPKITFGAVTLFEWQFVILGGMLFFLPVLMYMGEPVLWAKNPIAWTFWLNAAISMPHVNATYVRLQRKIGEGKVHAFIGFPLFIAFAAILAVATYYGRYLEAMTVVNVWQSFHYVRQVYGLSRVYAHENVESSRVRRLNFLAYHLAMPLFVLGRWSMLFQVWKGKPSDILIPVHMPDEVMTLCLCLAVVALLSGISAEIMKMRQNVYNPVGLVNLLVYFFIHWFGFLAPAYYMRGFFAVTIYHAIQYLALVWLTEKKQRKDPAVYLCLWGKVPTVLAFFSFWLVIFVVGYLVAVKMLPTLNTYWVEWAVVLLGAQSAHHYAVDYFLWQGKAGK